MLPMKILAMLALTAMLAAADPAHPSLPALAIPGGVGVNIHFTDAQPGEIEMLAAAGFRWVRMDFAWAATERERGQYDFAAYDRLMQALDAHGIRALFILDYGNALYDRERRRDRRGPAGLRPMGRGRRGAFQGPRHPLGNLERAEH